MINLKLRRREIDFLLYDLLKVDQVCAHPRYAMHDREVFDATLDVAIKVADEHFANHAAKVDAEEPHFDGERVHLIPEVKQGIDAYVAAGFMGTGFDLDDGGSQLPYAVAQGLAWVFAAANVGTAAYPFLTMAAANLIRAHGSPEQKARYLAPMIEGRWFGTMCLSEPQAGSSLGDIRTRAEATEHGYYRISGSKMWISGGEHELSENIIHLVLAKIPGGPAGSRGISLFIVPKRRINDDGSVAERNNVSLVGLNHKMGYRGTTNTLLNFGEAGECRGWLIGEVNHGLACMFHMMNEARIGVGLNAAVLGHTAYLHSLDYALGRPQGRKTGERDPTTPQVMIAEHPDVRRMLLVQKAFSEGALSLCLHGAALVDRLATAADDSEHAELNLELEILTPIIKAWPAHYGLEANYWGLQVLGGYGYTRDYPLERIYRDNRLNPIHEGTNGIQAADLLGRKVMMQNGAAFKLLMARIAATIDEASGEAELNEFTAALKAASERVVKTTMTLAAAGARGETDRMLANAWVYMELLGGLVIGWMWLRQMLCIARIASPSEADLDYFKGKRQAARYYYRWELPKLERHAVLLESLDDTLLMTDATQL
ncbi:acyl-CoA dehydrogenase [Nevskia sp.]|uniref:acyl-CoA dehydrogenase n=1 Tax=Nevskia sp. TaxID=1929292 RepID=UPI0025D8E726|nr:acyl-CoA dehydrogenase [Nevskia sp.]